MYFSHMVHDDTYAKQLFISQKYFDMSTKKYRNSSLFDSRIFSNSRKTLWKIIAHTAYAYSE